MNVLTVPPLEREILERGIADSSYVPILRATELKRLVGGKGSS